MPFARALTGTGAQRTMQALCSIAQTGVEARNKKANKSRHYAVFLFCSAIATPIFYGWPWWGAFGLPVSFLPVFHTPPSASHPRSFLLGGLAVFLFFSKQGPKP